MKILIHNLSLRAKRSNLSIKYFIDVMSQIASSQRSLLAMTVLLFSLNSCTTYNTATGRNEFIFVSTQEEVSMGNTIATKFRQEYEEETSSRYVDRINRIGQRVAQVSDRQDYSYQFHVIKKDELNAFTIPGGQVYVFTGLIDKLKTDDEIAFVIAHEIGHCSARHVVKKYQAALGYSLFGSILLNAFEAGSAARSVASLSTNMLSNLVFSAYGRGDEFEADRLGVKYTLLAGYDPNGAIGAMELLEKEAEQNNMPTILRTHPHAKDRLEKLRAEVEKAKETYK